MGKSIINYKTITKELEVLPQDKIKEVMDFIDYLKTKQEELEVTREILNDRDFLESIKRGKSDIKAGRFKDWNDVRENV